VNRWHCIAFLLHQQGRCPLILFCFQILSWIVFVNGGGYVRFSFRISVGRSHRTISWLHNSNAVQFPLDALITFHSFVHVIVLVVGVHTYKSIIHSIHSPIGSSNNWVVAIHKFIHSIVRFSMALIQTLGWFSFSFSLSYLPAYLSSSFHSRLWLPHYMLSLSFLSFRWIAIILHHCRWFIDVRWFLIFFVLIVGSLFHCILRNKTMRW